MKFIMKNFTFAPCVREYAARAAGGHEVWRARTLDYGGGITVVLVSPSMSSGFSMLESQLDPGATSRERPVDDSGEQGGFVLEGKLTIWLEGNEEPVTQRANDSFQLPARRRFRYANFADAPARVLWDFT